MAHYTLQSFHLHIPPLFLLLAFLPLLFIYFFSNHAFLSRDPLKPLRERLAPHSAADGQEPSSIHTAAWRGVVFEQTTIFYKKQKNKTTIPVWFSFAIIAAACTVLASKHHLSFLVLCFSALLHRRALSFTQAIAAPPLYFKQPKPLRRLFAPRLWRFQLTSFLNWCDGQNEKKNAMAAGF